MIFLKQVLFLKFLLSVTLDVDELQQIPEGPVSKGIKPKQQHKKQAILSYQRIMGYSSGGKAFAPHAQRPACVQSSGAALTEHGGPKLKS